MGADDARCGRPTELLAGSHVATISLLRLHPNGQLMYSCSSTDGVLHVRGHARAGRPPR
jgi:hypothetical protein